MCIFVVYCINEEKEAVNSSEKNTLYFGGRKMLRTRLNGKT